MAAPDAREAPHKYLQIQQFRTLNSQPSRTAIEQDEFSWLENLMPIGDAYAPVVPGPGATLASLNPPTGTVITASGVGTEMWAGDAASVGYTEPTVAGQLFGPYVGINELHNENDAPNTNFLWTEIAIFNGATRINTATVSVVGYTEGDYGSLANNIDNNLTDSSQNGSASTIASYLNKHYFIGFGFASPPVVTGLRIASYSLNSWAPTQADIIQSVDGTYWVRVAENVGGIKPSTGSTWGATVTFSTITPPGTKRYWRVGDFYTLNYPSGVTRNMKLTSLALYDGTTDKTSLASASSTITFATGTLADLFDGSFTTGVEILAANLGNIDFDFGVGGQSVNGVRLGVSAPFADEDKWPYQFLVYYSGDAASWTFAGKVAVNPFPGSISALTPTIRMY